MERYLFDTIAFNKALDDVDSIASTKNGIKICASHIQLREINNTKCAVRRARLLSIFHEITDEKLPAESSVFPIRFGATKFGDGTYEKLRNELDLESSSLPRKKRKGKHKSNPNDAQIAEIAIKNEITLVTNDTELLAVVRNNNGYVIRYEEFKSKIS